ncbi:MAG: class I SAM-dependent methyltransferase [Myxococcaceae bacterium]
MTSTGFTWRTESDAPAPTSLNAVGDALTADEALKRVRRGEVLLYEGDFHNARQLMGAMGRRLEKSKPVAKSALDAFRIERRSRAIEHETLGRIVVKLDPSYRLSLKRAPDVRVACEQAWGSAGGKDTVVAFKTLLGVLGAAEWRKKGLEVPGLKKPLAPHYGVYAPTRTEYVELVRALGHVEGAKVFDIGTGTGVLGLVLLAKGAASVVATDVDSRAVACARDNAQRFGVAKQMVVEERELFPEGKADLVVCNPPWVPEAPKTRVDRAVFDEGGAMLEAFLSGVRAHLTPKGRAVLIISNLAELLGLRAPGFLDDAFARHGLSVLRTHTAKAKHGKAKDVEDPLHAARSKEVTTIYELVSLSSRGGEGRGEE